MNQYKKSNLYYLILSICALSISLLIISGIVLKTDLVGKIILGSLWLIVSIGWFGQYIHKKVKNIDSKESDCVEV